MNLQSARKVYYFIFLLCVEWSGVGLELGDGRKRKDDEIGADIMYKYKIYQYEIAILRKLLLGVAGGASA